MSALLRHWSKWSGWYLFLASVSAWLYLLALIFREGWIEKKGQFRIAAHLWLQCMDVASGDVERARIAVRRDQCITNGNGLRRGDYSGIGCCGVVYD